MDGYLDFSMRSDCGGPCYDNFYIYNPAIKKFEHLKEWDGLRIARINQKTKQILGNTDGTSGYGIQILYKLVNNKLTIQKKYTYGNEY
jgi:hypothetical protein